MRSQYGLGEAYQVVNGTDAARQDSVEAMVQTQGQGSAAHEGDFLPGTVEQGEMKADAAGEEWSANRLLTSPRRRAAVASNRPRRRLRREEGTLGETYRCLSFAC